MPDRIEFQIRVVNSFKEIDAQQWDSLAVTKQFDGSKTDNPFIKHAFLSALEESGSACVDTGWLGQHLILENSKGTALAAMPCYLKNHSQGEYVFDHGWADAFYRAGGEYYPKLQCSVPFTPATGPRFLTGNSASPPTLQAALSDGLKQLTKRLGASSAHITFMCEDEWRNAKNDDLLQRKDRQFHWINKDYDDFDGFLNELSSRKRKNIKKERLNALSKNGISIDIITGADITESIWDVFYGFYMDTGARKWGRPYLTRSFYSLLSERMADNILLIMAKRDGEYVAGAINFIGDDCLYGRHWGCSEDHPFLHFEICYYQAIEFAISNKLKRVEAGAQGEHKLARGYEPVTTYSAHHIANPSFRLAIENYLVNERSYVEKETSFLSEHVPFRKS